MPRTLKMMLIMLLPALAVFGCHEKDREAVAQVEQLIQQNLKPGDPATKIEEFLKQHGFPYNFNEFEHRYETGVPASRKTDSKGVESVITINIYVNPDRSFQRAEVRTTNTYL